MSNEGPGETGRAPTASRVVLKPPGSAAGFVDGAWWPRSPDLVAELPALVAVLAGRLGRAGRVTFNLTSWRPPPRRLVVDGRDVRLEGFRTQHANTLTVIGTDRRTRLTLLVIPPAADPEHAYQVLDTAAGRDNVDSPDALLHDRAASATQRWETEGGRLQRV